MSLLTSDRRLLDAFRRGERAALEQVYAAYVRQLASFLRSGFSFNSKGSSRYFQGIRSAHELDNALQDIFVRAFSDKGREGYDGLRPYLNYLFAIAKNYVIDELRRARTRSSHTVDLDDAEAEAADQQREPGMEVEDRELTTLLTSFVAGRSERERALYDLRYRDHITQNEAAARLGLSRAQVRRLEARLLSDLLHHLRKHGYLTEHDVAIPVLIRGAGVFVFAVSLTWTLWRSTP